MTSSSSTNKMLPTVTAVVVGLNEGKYLQKCLSAILFCDKVVYLDLGSKDNSIEIADSVKGVEVRQIDRVPVVEIIHSEIKKYAETDWVLLIDPDEHINIELSKKLENQLDGLLTQENVGMIEVPLFYYFKGKKLKGTVWGGLRYRNIFLNRRGVDFFPNVHEGKKLKTNYEVVRIDFAENDFIEHHWSSSIFSLYRKHSRYLKHEGLVRYNSGKRVTFQFVWRMIPDRFWACFVRNKGYLDGFNGLALSLLWCWYETAAAYEIYKVQQKLA